MPSADPRAAEIIKVVADFEASVDGAEVALVARDWVSVEAALSDQHRLTHALANLLEATQACRPAAFSEEVDRRMAGISERRDDQLRRLIAFNHLVTSRLSMMARARHLRRTGVDTRGASRILDTHR